MPEGHVVERLHDVRRAQVPLEHFAARQGALVQLRYPAVALRNVVDCVQDWLAGQRLRRYRQVGPRELLNTTSRPAATANRATVPLVFPLPIKPIVVISLVTA